MKRKKILALLLTACFLVAAVQTASAANSITITITPSKTEAIAGEEVTFTITMGSAAGTNLTSFQFYIDLPAGMRYKDGSGVIDPNFIADTGLAAVNFDDEPKLFVSGYGDSPYNGQDEIIIATFACTVSSEGSQTVTLSTARYYENAITRKDFTVTPAVVATTAKENPETFDGATWHIPADSGKDIVLSRDGWLVDNVLGDYAAGSLTYAEGEAVITVAPNAAPFSAIVRLVSADKKKTWYVGIEKPVSVSAGTSFDGNTWVVSSGSSALMEMKGWTVVSILGDAPNGALTWTSSTINITADTRAFDAIVKLKGTNGKVKYIGIERH